MDNAFPNKKEEKKEPENLDSDAKRASEEVNEVMEKDGNSADEEQKKVKNFYLRLDKVLHPFI